jgi:phosphatidylinositol alpha-mannosyltransferase
MAGMKIALVCPYAWDAPGGVQVHVADLAAHLAARRHLVRGIAPFLGRPEPGWVRATGWALRVPYRGTIAPIAPSPLGIGRMRQDLERFQADVVHVHEPFTPSTSMWAVLASPAPVVATFHAHLDRSRLMEFAAPALRSVARRIAVGIAVSDAAARFVRAAFPDMLLEIVPNAIDVRSFERATPASVPAGRVVLWVGRLDPQKGFGVMVDAFERLAARVPDARLVVAGDGHDRFAIDRLLPDVRERVAMLGAVDHASVPGLMAAADVVVSPALGQESFGIVLLEAMAAGVPVVATDIDGYREVARDDVDALLVPPGDAGAVATAIERALSDEGLANRLVAAGRARARTFDWPSIAALLEGLYRRAIDAGPPPIR